MLPNCNWLVRHIGLEGIHPHMQEEERKSKTLVFGLFTNTKLGLERIWRYGLASQYKKNFLPFITSFNLHLEAILVGVQIAREVNLE